MHPAPPLFFPATTNITVQLETENNSPSGGENYITMTTLKKFNYQQEGADDVLIVPYVCWFPAYSTPTLLLPLLAGSCWSWYIMGVCCFVCLCVDE